MSTLVEKINQVVIPSLVVKCDLWGVELEQYVIYPNAVDSFVVSSGFIRKSESLVNKETMEYRTASLGSKMIGSYRDKGSITGIVEDKYMIMCAMVFDKETERDNFCNFLKTIKTEHYVYTNKSGDKWQVAFEPDVIAGTSTSRDNVNALLIDGLMELDCIIENKEVSMSIEELSSVTIENLADIRKRDWELFIVEKETMKKVHNFGEHLVIFEYFFWQPMHDNNSYISKKKINCLYHQSVDGFQIYMPSVYEAIQNSVDYNSVKEDMLCLGVDFIKDYDPNKADELKAILKPESNDWE